MSDIHASYGSPHIGKVGHINPDNFMREILDANSSLKKNLKGACESLIHDALGDLGEYVPSDLLMAMLYSEATRSFWRVTTKLTKPKTVKQVEQQYQEAKQAAVKEKEKAGKIVQHVLLSTVRRMTGAECAAAAKSSKGYARLAKKVKRNQIVGDVLSDAQIVKELRGS